MQVRTVIHKTAYIAIYDTVFTIFENTVAVRTTKSWGAQFLACSAASHKHNKVFLDFTLPYPGLSSSGDCNSVAVNQRGYSQVTKIFKQYICIRSSSGKSSNCASISTKHVCFSCRYLYQFCRTPLISTGSRYWESATWMRLSLRASQMML